MNLLNARASAANRFCRAIVGKKEGNHCPWHFQFRFCFCHNGNASVGTLLLAYMASLSCQAPMTSKGGKLKSWKHSCRSLPREFIMQLLRSTLCCLLLFVISFHLFDELEALRFQDLLLATPGQGEIFFLQLCLVSLAAESLRIFAFPFKGFKGHNPKAAATRTVSHLHRFPFFSGALSHSF